MKKLPKKHFTLFILLAILFGGTAGIITSIQTERFLDRYREILDERGVPPRLGDERPRELPGTYSDALESVREQATPVLVRLHKRVSSTTNITRASYLDTDAIGSGILLSSDGWMMTSSTLFLPTAIANIVAVVDGEVIDVLDAVVDDATGTMFVQLDASDLSVARFGQSENIQAGDWAFVLDVNGGLVPTSVVREENTNDLVDAAEELGIFLVLRDGVASSAIGAPVVNGAGEVVGIMAQTPSLATTTLTYVRPLHIIMPVIKSVLRDRVVTRPSFGAEVVAMNRAVGYPSMGDTGALVVSVDRGGSAYDAEIFVNDVIVRLNGEEVGLNRNIEEILLEFNPADTVTVSLKRGEEELDVEVVLGDLSE